jgi:hypothetical protein
MRRLTTLVLVSALVLGPGTLPVNAAGAEPAAAVAAAAPRSDHRRLLVVGAGAIIGIVVFNWLTYPWGSVPFVAGPLAATPMDIALGSRVLAALAGGAGALAAHYLYQSQVGDLSPSSH